MRTKNTHSLGVLKVTNELLGIGVLPGLEILKAKADSSVGFIVIPFSVPQ